MIFKCRKIVRFRGFAPDPTGGAYSAPPDPLAGVEELNQYGVYCLTNGLIWPSTTGLLLKKKFVVCLISPRNFSDHFLPAYFLVLIINQNCG